MDHDLWKRLNSLILTDLVTLIPGTVDEDNFSKRELCFHTTISAITGLKLVQTLAFLARENKNSLVLKQKIALKHNTYFSDHLAVVWDVGVNVDVDMVRGQQLGVHRRGLALNLPWVLHNVNLLVKGSFTV